MCTYNAIIHRDEGGGYWAEVPALPGCYTDGDTLAEVKANLPKAIRFHLEGLNSFEVPTDARLARVRV